MDYPIPPWGCLPLAPEDAVLGTFHVAVREGRAYTSPPSADVALVPAGWWPIPGRRLGRSTSGSKGPELPGVRRLRGPPRPPLPGCGPGHGAASLSRLRLRDALPGPAAAPRPPRAPVSSARAPGRPRLSLDPGPAIDRPCRCPPPLPPRTPAPPLTGRPVLPVPSSASPPHSSSPPAPSSARATSQPLSGPTSTPIPSPPEPARQTPSFLCGLRGAPLSPPRHRNTCISVSCFLPPLLRLASPHPHPRTVQPLFSGSPDAFPGPPDRPPSSHTVSDRP